MSTNPIQKNKQPYPNHIQNSKNSKIGMAEEENTTE
jgi:hypothetical protein